MKQKYVGQSPYELGQRPAINHQDQAIGGALGDSMKQKYAG